MAWHRESRAKGETLEEQSWGLALPVLSHNDGGHHVLENGGASHLHVERSTWKRWAGFGRSTGPLELHRSPRRHFTRQTEGTSYSARGAVADGAGFLSRWPRTPLNFELGTLRIGGAAFKVETRNGADTRSAAHQLHAACIDQRHEMRQGDRERRRREESRCPPRPLFARLVFTAPPR